MLWIFERDTERLQLETTYDTVTAQFVLTIGPPGQESQVERFSDQVDFRQRLEALEEQLQGEHWAQTSMRLLRDGWKIG
jgi:hypothetical protein